MAHVCPAAVDYILSDTLDESCALLLGKSSASAAPQRTVPLVDPVECAFERESTFFTHIALGLSLHQSVKQRFSTWFNKRHKRKGTLWEERFKSVVAMGPEAVASVAAYIDLTKPKKGDGTSKNRPTRCGCRPAETRPSHPKGSSRSDVISATTRGLERTFASSIFLSRLNPVRAGLGEDPGDYRWSGYGEALGGGKGAKQAQRGLQRALCDREGSLLSSKETRENYLEWYRCWIYGRGEARGVNEDGQSLKPGFGPTDVVEVIGAEGRIPAAEQLTRTVRHFTDGLVLGTGALLTAVFEAQRAYFGPKRKSGPRKIRGGDWGPLRAMRDLQREDVNQPQRTKSLGS